MKYDKPHPNTNGYNPLAIPPNHVISLSYDLIKLWRLRALYPSIKAYQHLTIGKKEISKF